MDSIPHLNLTVDRKAKEDVTLLKDLLASVRPEWAVEDVKIEDLSAVGYVNINLILRHKGSREDAIFVRVTNPFMLETIGSHLFLARKFVHKHGLSAKLLATFGNGFVEECLQGEGITWATKERVKEEKVERAIVQEMIRYHEKKVLDAAIDWKFPDDISVCDKTALDACWDLIEQAGHEESALAALPGFDVLLKERKELINVMDKLGARKAFCHHDVNPANVFILENGEVRFTDYETPCVFYVAAEIAYYFFMLNFDAKTVVFETYPDAEYRRAFCRRYLEMTYQSRGENKAVTQQQLDTFESHVAVGKLLSSLVLTSYIYYFLTPTIFNTTYPAAETMMAIHGMWQYYYAEKKEVLSSLGFD